MRGGAPRRKFWAILHVFNTKKAKSWESSKTRTNDGRPPLRLVAHSALSVGLTSALLLLLLPQLLPWMLQQPCRHAFRSRDAHAAAMSSIHDAFCMCTTYARFFVPHAFEPCVAVQPFAAQRLLFDELCQSLGLRKLSRMQCFDRTLRFCYWCRSCHASRRVQLKLCTQVYLYGESENLAKGHSGKCAFSRAPESSALHMPN